MAGRRIARPFGHPARESVVEETELKGLPVMVTGASRGLGRALAEAYAAAGARLVLCARGEADLARVAESLERTGADVEWAAADVGDEEAIGGLVARAADRFGPIRALVNNASVLGPRVPLRDHPLDAWRQVLEVNVTGTLIPTLAVLPGMRDGGGGSVITVSSGVGNVARGRWGAYAVSKWAVEGFSRNLALEEEGAGVRVNIVDPGRLRTGMRRAAYPEEDPTEPTPPEEAVGVFLWLASPASAGVTGQRFHALEWP
jgi:NAD(P)-dependent dehydrogenase (short-subunit alcohol dehydrogenase family)